MGANLSISDTSLADPSHICGQLSRDDQRGCARYLTAAMPLCIERVPRALRRSIPPVAKVADERYQRVGPRVHVDSAAVNSGRQVGSAVPIAAQLPVAPRVLRCFTGARPERRTRLRVAAGQIWLGHSVCARIDLPGRVRAVPPLTAPRRFHPVGQALVEVWRLEHIASPLASRLTGTRDVVVRRFGRSPRPRRRRAPS
jgi:hypothetical protein